MLLYRVSMGEYASDLSGEGARLAGGRWNSKGIPLLYTSDHPAIAFLEVYAGIAPTNLPPTLKLVTIGVPDSFAIRTIKKSDLPGDWNARPPRHAAMRIGDAWQRSQATPLLKVPSAVVPLGVGWNLILNPQHPEFAGNCKLVSVTDWKVDSRLK